MATYAVTDAQLTAIADEIRLKRGYVNPIGVSDMPLEISLISGGGSSGYEFIKEFVINSALDDITGNSYLAYDVTTSDLENYNSFAILLNTLQQYAQTSDPSNPTGSKLSIRVYFGSTYEQINIGTSTTLEYTIPSQTIPMPIIITRDVYNKVIITTAMNSVKTTNINFDNITRIMFVCDNYRRFCGNTGTYIKIYGSDLDICNGLRQLV